MFEVNNLLVSYSPDITLDETSSFFTTNQAYFTLSVHVDSSPFKSTTYEMNAQCNALLFNGVSSNKLNNGTNTLTKELSATGVPIFKPYSTATKVVVFKYLLNSFGINLKATDNITINFYSDFYGDLIPCGPLKI